MNWKEKLKPGDKIKLRCVHCGNIFKTKVRKTYDSKCPKCDSNNLEII